MVRGREKRATVFCVCLERAEEFRPLCLSVHPHTLPFPLPLETVNILEDDALRAGLKEYSQWPTFPQLYAGSELVGGCDIMISMYQSGELTQVLEVAMNQ